MDISHDSVDNLYHSATHKNERLIELYERVKGLEGDLAEFGVYHGYNTRFMARLAPHRSVWAFDTFEGMPEEDYQNLNGEDKSDPPGKWAPLVEPQQLFKGYENVKIVKGRFADTLPTMPGDLKFALVHIDCDWYTSHVQVLGWLSEHLVPGALLLFDDPTLPGAARAISEWRQAVGDKQKEEDTYTTLWRG